MAVGAEKASQPVSFLSNFYQKTRAQKNLKKMNRALFLGAKNRNVSVQQNRRPSFWMQKASEGADAMTKPWDKNDNNNNDTGKHR